MLLLLLIILHTVILFFYFFWLLYFYYIYLLTYFYFIFIICHVQMGTYGNELNSRVASLPGRFVGLTSKSIHLLIVHFTC